jgi:hypothetical protein
MEFLEQKIKDFNMKIDGQEIILKNTKKEKEEIERKIRQIIYERDNWTDDEKDIIYGNNHDEQGDYCKKCKIHFSSYYSKDKDIWNKINRKDFACPTCCKTDDEKKKYIADNIEKVEKDKLTFYKCEKCNKQFKRPELFLCNEKRHFSRWKTLCKECLENSSICYCRGCGDYHSDNRCGSDYICRNCNRLSDEDYCDTCSQPIE